MEIINKNEPVKFDKRTLNKGKPKGARDYKVYKWKVTLFDRETNQLKEGKFCSIPHLNEEWGLKLTSDIVHRIQTNYRADMTMRNGKNSFLYRWGHIKLEKIREPVEIYNNLEKIKLK